MQLGFIFVLIVSIFIAIFAIQNGNPVDVDLFFFQPKPPLAVVMMICLILGAVIVLILGTFRQVKKISESKELKNKIKALEGEKIQFENNVKNLNDEIQKLTENNNALTVQLSKLQEKINEQEILIANYKEEVQINNSTSEAEIEEGAGLNINNENSEAHSE